MTTVEEFKASLRGHLLHAGEDGYDEARKIWNGMFDRRPALIARCAGAADVVSAVNFARDNRLQVAVRGGGHSFPGHSVCDGGLVIDLSPMKGVRVDSAARTARAQPGIKWIEFDRETQAFGLATTGALPPILGSLDLRSVAALAGCPISTALPLTISSRPMWLSPTDGC
jgi:FAD/FMN-containing dehydrogenase